MQPESRDAAYLWDMLEAAKEVVEMTGNVGLEAFLGNRVLIRATERSIEIIGEAAGRISSSFKSAHAEIAWHKIKGQRNILAHQYGQVDHKILFETAKADVPHLISKLETLLPPLNSG